LDVIVLGHEDTPAMPDQMRRTETLVMSRYSSVVNKFLDIRATTYFEANTPAIAANP
jgi:hypothetical protein